jgi:hypothetical protein
MAQKSCGHDSGALCEWGGLGGERERQGRNSLNPRALRNALSAITPYFT